MGDRRKQALRVQFDGKLKLEFQGARITSDAWLLAFPELDEGLRLAGLEERPRRGRPARFSPRRGDRDQGAGV